jgi:predicted anti-sigma-YlaC factor YlaD
MKSPFCREFDDWLERLPRTELSPAFKKHLEECDLCRDLFERLAGVTDALASAAVSLPAFSPAKLDVLARTALRESARLDKGRLVLKISLAGLLSLPLAVLINWLGASLSYNFLAAHVSPLLAKAFFVTLIATAVAFSGLAFASLFLMAGKIRGRKHEERMI